MTTKYNLTYSQPALFLAIHTGHQLSENIASKIGISDLDRMREEDPFTEQFISDKENHIIQYTSRFEYDLNRKRENAVYQTPDDCWGLPIYQAARHCEVSSCDANKAIHFETTDNGLFRKNRKPTPRNDEYESINRGNLLTPTEINSSLRQYDTFYQELTNIIEKFLQHHEKLIVWDIHSYNHRRKGVNADFDSDEENPEIIIGTNRYQYMPRKWEPNVSQIEQSFKSRPFIGDFPNRSLKQPHLDVRQNIKFPGGYLSQFINHRYGDRVCCLAIEFKKIWMNEWTQEIDEVCFGRLKEIFNQVVAQ
jgi:N-formylglutamate amidohydrolase